MDQPDRDIPAVNGDLELFGFDDGAERWIDHFRGATAASSLGTLGAYEVLEEIDRGGQGIVYRARQPGLQRTIAIKRLRAGSFATAETRRRFEREIEAAAALSHPNIVSVLAVDTIDGQPVLAMQWIDGVALMDWAQGRTVDDIIDLFLKVCDAVHHAHQRGVIHRDLKPSNILVSAPDGDDAQPHVLDFGLAKFAAGDDRDESLSGFAGTPAFASPEQVDGRADDIDVRTDVYSLGVILFRLLTSRMPYAVDGPLVQTLQAIRATDPMRPSSIRPELDREIDAIVLKALAKAREDRYQSVAALADDLQRHRRHEPVAAHPPHWRYLVRKFIARHCIGCAAAGVIVLMILTFAAAMAQSLQRQAEAGRVARQVSEFLQDTLSAAGPSRLGANVTLLDAMQDAAQRADRELGDQPRVAAEVYETVGRTFMNLWRAREALPYLHKAVALHRQEQGERSEEASRSLTTLGRALANCSDPAAVDVMREALSIRQSLHGKEHPLVAECKMRLGYALFRAARPPNYDEAESLLMEALAMCRRTLGPKRREVASCLHNLGFMRLAQGRMAEAEALYHEALDLLDEVAAPDDPYRIECLHGYSSILLTLKRHEEAVVVLEESIPLVQRMYGSEPTTVLHKRLAMALTEIGEYKRAERAVALHVAGVLRNAAADPERSPAEQRELADLSRYVESSSDQQEPLPAHELVEACRSMPAEPRPQIMAALRQFGAIQQLRGDLDGAAAVFEGLLSLSKRTIDKAASLTDMLSLEALGDIAMERGQFLKAEPYLRQAQELRIKHLPGDERTLARLGAKLGLCLHRLGRDSEAEPLLRQAHVALKSDPGEGNQLIGQVDTALDELGSEIAPQP